MTAADKRRRGGHPALPRAGVPGARDPRGGVRRNAGDGRHRWMLDPIDGTKSFIHHVPLFGTLWRWKRDGVPVVGVIACHAAGETASAARVTAPG